MLVLTLELGTLDQEAYVSLPGPDGEVVRVKVRFLEQKGRKLKLGFIAPDCVEINRGSVQAKIDGDWWD